MSAETITAPCMVRYRTQEESRSGVYSAFLVKQGPKYTQVVFMDSAGIRIKRVKKSEERYMKLMTCDLEKAKKLFRSAVKRYNNGHVSNALKEALKCQDH